MEIQSMFIVPFLSLYACQSEDAQLDVQSRSILAPIAIIEGPAEVTVGDAVMLSGDQSFHPQDEKIAQYEWSCDNETEGEGVSFSFVPESEGEIQCILEVTSSRGEVGQTAIDILVEKPENPQWTFMVFINGDSDLEYAGIDDINEMEFVGSSEDVNIVVQYDRSREFATEDGDWHGARRYRIEADDSENIGSPVLEDLGEVDS